MLVSGTGEGVSAKHVQERFAKRQKAIMQCYDKEISTGNIAKGIVQIDFMIWTDGCAAEVKAVSKEKALQTTASCVAAIVKGFCFDGAVASPLRYRTGMLFEPVSQKSQRRR